MNQILLYEAGKILEASSSIITDTMGEYECMRIIACIIGLAPNEREDILKKAKESFKPDTNGIFRVDIIKKIQRSFLER